MRTVRDDAPLVHIVRERFSRGFNGTEFRTACNGWIMTSENWSKGQEEVPTCIICLGTPKRCAVCRRPIAVPVLLEEYERCEGCVL